MLRIDKLLPAGRLAPALSKRASRLRLEDGTEVGLFLPRGTVLRGGAMLVADDGRLVIVVAAPQQVLQVSSRDPLALMRAAYHLGNRHTPVEVSVDYLRLEYDPVLADMLVRLGADVQRLDAPFEPEAGAYGGGHKHGHDETFAEDYALAQSAFRHHHGAGSATG